MTEEANPEKRRWHEGMIWPLVLSVALIVSTAAYVWWKTYNPKGDDWVPGSFWSMMKAISVADVGQFISGVAGALVFVWIVYTYAVQREELALQRDEMKAQRAEFNKMAAEQHTQSAILAENAVVTKRDAFIRYLELRERSMALDTAELIKLTVTAGEHSRGLERAWGDYSRGDAYAFFRAIFAQMLSGEGGDFMVRATRVRGGLELVHRLINEANRTIEGAKEIDDEMHRLCFNTPWNELAARFSRWLEEASREGP